MTEDKAYAEAYPRALIDVLLSRRRARLEMFGDLPDCFEVTPQEWEALIRWQDTVGAIPSVLAPLPDLRNYGLFGVPIHFVEEGGIA